MFPHPDNPPAGIKQGLVGFPIPLDVTSEFCFPKLDIRFWQCPMIRAPMPEAAVDKNGYLRTTKDDVSSSWKGWDRPNVHAVAETHSVQLPPQRKLWTRVP